MAEQFDKVKSDLTYMVGQSIEVIHKLKEVADSHNAGTLADNGLPLKQLADLIQENRDTVLNMITSIKEAEEAVNSKFYSLQERISDLEGDKHENR